MSRSNYDKPFYVDVGTSIAAVRCASNHDVVYWLDHVIRHSAIKDVEELCDRLNKEAELFFPSRAIEKSQEKKYEYAVQCHAMCGDGRMRWFTISEWRKDKDDAINDWLRFVARNPDVTYKARYVRREVGDIEVLGGVKGVEVANDQA
ncbi:MAG: hypothetical protein J6V72_18675 [Kiritimatiellae bacterium]|nr:hypothetical protein [Kiritimatiellia bacterium]